jgi:SNF2 family DNA or RNA helicase
VDESELSRAALLADNFNLNNHEALLSLGAPKAEFVPFQYKPLINLINSPQKRLLIADDVGVGKTIEAGIIHRELQARGEVETTLIVCPKPLVAQKKWTQELTRRFDENFVHMNRLEFQLALKHAYIEGSWPRKYRKAIIPFSIIDSGLVGKGDRINQIGIKQLDIKKYFDLVIIDEAHHARNYGTQRHQFAEQLSRLTKYLVLMSATPLQNKLEDLYTLLQIIDPETFTNYSDFLMRNSPNTYINRAAQEARSGLDGWEGRVKGLLELSIETSWGTKYIRNSPEYSSITKMLVGETLDRHNRIEILRLIEKMNSFSRYISRTRRRDLSMKFPKRVVRSIRYQFTTLERDIYTQVIEVLEAIVAENHGESSVQFLTANMKRQLSSSISGLGLFLEKITNSYKETMNELKNESLDENSLDIASKDIMPDWLKRSNNEINNLINILDEYDTKYEIFSEIIHEKKGVPNDKVIVFTSFRYSQSYLASRLTAEGYKIGVINGDTHDHSRNEQAHKFSNPSSDPESLQILICTEVGSEGLDYQFCDTIINYDLPWNPMRIEQRIGRIDRFGQKSDRVNVINLIGDGTYDEYVFELCYKKIGIFENSVGTGEQILGEISDTLSSILSSMKLNHADISKMRDIFLDSQVQSYLANRDLEERYSALSNSITPIFDEEILQLNLIDYFDQSAENILESFFSSIQQGIRYRIQPNEMTIIKLQKESKEIVVRISKLIGAQYFSTRPWNEWLNSDSLEFSFTFNGSLAAITENAFKVYRYHPIVGIAEYWFQESAKS